MLLFYCTSSPCYCLLFKIEVALEGCDVLLENCLLSSYTNPPLPATASLFDLYCGDVCSLKHITNLLFKYLYATMFLKTKSCFATPLYNFSEENIQYLIVVFYCCFVTSLFASIFSMADSRIQWLEQQYEYFSPEHKGWWTWHQPHFCWYMYPLWQRLGNSLTIQYPLSVIDRDVSYSW